MGNTSDDLVQFVDNEFDSATASASLEEAAEFAFGDLNSAIASFEKTNGRRYSKKEDYLDDEEFFNFVYSELDDVISWASTEELADWGFGGIQEAKNEFRKRNSST